MHTPAFGSFHQMAWVTPDLDRSLAQYRDVYGIPRFFVMEQQFDARVGELRGKMKLRIALANVDGVELELIEPASPGIDSIYRDVLPGGGVHANVFHHICVKVHGTLDDWHRHLAELPKERAIYYDGDVGPGARFVYTDDRALLGHYIEHVWFGPEVDRHMREAVPRFNTK